MAETQGKGKKGRKLGRNKTKCERYRMRHGGGLNKKIVGSKAHRGCGPLGYYNRNKAMLDKKYGVYKHPTSRVDREPDVSGARVKIK
jgi:hypothetical protein